MRDVITFITFGLSCLNIGFAIGNWLAIAMIGKLYREEEK